MYAHNQGSIPGPGAYLVDAGKVGRNKSGSKLELLSEKKKTPSISFGAKFKHLEELEDTSKKPAPNSYHPNAIATLKQQP